MTALAPSPTFSCGHPRTPENTGTGYSVRCLTCRRAHARRQWAEQDPAERRFDAEVRRLPGQLEASLRKTKALLERHDRLGMHLEEEASRLLREIYGDFSPGLVAELEYQRARKG